MKMQSAQSALCYSGRLAQVIAAKGIRHRAIETVPHHQWHPLQRSISITLYLWPQSSLHPCIESRWRSRITTAELIDKEVQL